MKKIMIFLLLGASVLGLNAAHKVMWDSQFVGENRSWNQNSAIEFNATGAQCLFFAQGWGGLGINWGDAKLPNSPTYNYLNLTIRFNNKANQELPDLSNFKVQLGLGVGKTSNAILLKPFLKSTQTISIPLSEFGSNINQTQIAQIIFSNLAPKENFIDFTVEQISFSQEPNNQKIVITDGNAKKYTLNTTNVDTSDWFPTPLPATQSLANTPLDMSHLLDAPAGKHGFIRANGENLEFANGQRVRLWGINMVGAANFSSKEQAEKQAKKLAECGFNLVRLHHLDLKWAKRNIFGTQEAKSSNQFDSENLDRLDYFIYQLKKQGIYIYLDLICSHDVYENDGINSPEDITLGYKIEGIFDEHLKELQRNFIQKLLTHHNPYTQMRYCDDPAIAFLGLKNEDTIFALTLPKPHNKKYSITTDYYKDKFQKLFNQWLIKKYGDTATLQKSWSEENKLGVEASENLEKQSVKVFFEVRHILKSDLSKKYSKTRVLDNYNFCYDLQKSYYDELVNFTRATGTKSLIASGNHWFNDNYPAYRVEAEYDFFDSHAYHNHPYDTFTYQKNAACKIDSLIKNYFASAIAELANRQVYGKPYVIGEYNAPAPFDYKSTYTAAMALYGSLKNWTPILFGFSSDEAPLDYLRNVLDVYNQADMMALIPHASLIFLRGDIKEATTHYYVEMNKEIAINPFKTKSLKRPKSAFLGKSGILFNDVVKLDNSIKNITDYKLKDGISISDTKELIWDRNQGLICIDTPKTQGVIGFKNSKPIETKDLSLKMENDYSITLLSSLDNLPIKSAKKMLLTIITRTRPSAMRLTPITLFGRDGAKISFPGVSPILVEPAVGEIILKNQTNLTAKTLSGENIPVTTLNNSTVLKLTGSEKSMTFIIERD